jgi:hypothetical protein
MTPEEQEKVDLIKELLHQAETFVLLCKYHQEEEGKDTKAEEWWLEKYETLRKVKP